MQTNNPVPSSLGNGMSAVASSLVQQDKPKPAVVAAQPKASAASSLPASVQAQYGSLAAQAKSNQDTIISALHGLESDEDKALADMQKAQAAADETRMAASYRLQQRQRILAVDRAKAFKKFLPIIGLFALVGGAAGGLSGALVAVAGGMAGFTRGMNQKYKEAWDNLNAQYKRISDNAKQTVADAEKVFDDTSKSIHDKVADLRIIAAAGAPMMRVGIDKAHTEEQQYLVYVRNANKLKTATQKAGEAFSNFSLSAAPPTPADVAAMAKVIGTPTDAKGVPLKGDALKQAEVARHAAIVQYATAVNQERAKHPDWTPEVARQKVMHAFSLKDLVDKHITPEQIEAKVDPGSEQTQATDAGIFTIAQLRAMPVSQIHAFAASHNGLTPAGNAVYTSYTEAEGRAPYMSYHGMGAQVGAYNTEGAQLVALGIDPSRASMLRANFHARQVTLAAVQKETTGLSVNIDAFENNGRELTDLARQLNLSRFPTADAAINWMKRQGGNTVAARYLQFHNDMTQEYARIIQLAPSGTTTHEEALKEANARLSANASPEVTQATVESAVQAGRAEIASRRAALVGLDNALGGGGLSQQVDEVNTGANAAPPPASSAGPGDKYLGGG